MKESNKFLTILFTIAVLFLPLETMAKKVHGTFRVVKGDVKVKSPNGKVKRAKIGQKVFPKDTIIAAKDSRAKIVMIDENVINISPDSEIVFEKYEFEPKSEKKNVLLNVIYGKVRSKVNQKYDGAKNKFQVKTPSAVAGVRGTDFFTSFNKSDNSSRVVTFEGEVNYGLPGPGGTIKNAVSVRAGEMASNNGSRPPARPRPVPKSQLAQMDQSSDAEKAEASDSRTPADDKGAGKDNKKEKENQNNGNAGENSKGAKGPGETKRTPASSTTSMLIDSDVPGTDAGGAAPLDLGPDVPEIPPSWGPPVDPTAFQNDTLTDIIRNQIEGGNTQLTVIINN